MTTSVSDPLAVRVEYARRKLELLEASRQRLTILLAPAGAPRDHVAAQALQDAELASYKQYAKVDALERLLARVEEAVT